MQIYENLSFGLKCWLDRCCLACTLFFFSVDVRHECEILVGGDGEDEWSLHAGLVGARHNDVAIGLAGQHHFGADLVPRDEPLIVFIQNGVLRGLLVVLT